MSLGASLKEEEVSQSDVMSGEVAVGRGLLTTRH